MESDRSKARIIKLSIVIVILLSAVSGALTWRYVDMRWRAETVRRGCARWVVSDDHGGTKYEWVERK